MNNIMTEKSVMDAVALMYIAQDTIEQNIYLIKYRHKIKMPNKDLIKFIKEARKRGFDDYQIRQPLLQKGWPINLIQEAFASLEKNQKQEKKNQYKNKVTIYLDDELLKILEKRAKKNMFDLNEQVEDILRRSCINLKKKKSIFDKDIDDTLVPLFSRRRYKK